MRFVLYGPWRCVVLCLLFLGVPAALWGAQAQEPAEPVYFERLAIAPFFVGQRQPLIDQDQDEDEDQVLRCTINEICVNDPSILPEAGPTLTQLAYQQLRRRFGPHIVPLDQSRAAYTQIVIDKQKDTLWTVVRKMGELLDADCILIGTVRRYRDRGAIKAIPDIPASVAFALYLVQVDTGELVWWQSYDGTQETVLSNLFKAGERIKMGLTWLSADELASHGMGEAFGQFPDKLQPLVTPSVRQPVVPEIKNTKQ